MAMKVPLATFDDKAEPVIARYRAAWAAANGEPAPRVLVWTEGWLRVEGFAAKLRLKDLDAAAARMEELAARNAAAKST